MPRKPLLRAAEYRRLAHEADALAASSPLTNVSEKHRHAAARWMALALLDERAAEPATAREAQAASAPIQKETPCIS